MPCRAGKTRYKTCHLTNKADCKGAVRPCYPDFFRFAPFPHARHSANKFAFCAHLSGYSFCSERNEAKNAAAVSASHGKTRPCEA